MEESKKIHYPVKSLSFFAGLALSAVLSWFAVNQYLTALPVAEENLRGVALSLSAAVEAISGRDPSFRAVEELRSRDIAYLVVIDRKGTILYHSNQALIGKRVRDQRFAYVFEKWGFFASRVTLGTGEEVYESNFPIHSHGRTVDLRLALHTYRADSVIRRARTGMAVLFSLIGAMWVMGILLYRSALRADTQRREMARREQLARLGEMGAVIAHEIRNPLAGIKGYAQLLQERLGGEENGGPAGLIVSQAVRLEEMVNGLLSYSRQERGEFTAVDIDTVLAGALEIIRPEAEAGNVSIVTSIRDHLSIEGNRDRLQQLFLNLLGNAVQAMPGGGEMRIDATGGKSGVEVRVCDSGFGIDAKGMERLFEPFFTTKARGAGLGLAVSRKIVEEHGGRITVESRPGEGTTFIIAFPGIGVGLKK